MRRLATGDRRLTARPQADRGAHTLMEMMVSVSVCGLLAAGMTSVIAISGRTLELAHGPAARVSDSARLYERVSQDLRMALRFTEATATAVTFTVPDRNNDGRPETIRYAWSGDPDYQVTQQVRLSAGADATSPAVIADDVRDFRLDYLLRTWGTPAPPQELESDEALLTSHDDRPEGDGRRVLFLTRDDGALTSQESARCGLLQAQGFTVQTIAASSTQAALDAAIAQNDAVYISERVRTSDVSGKLADPPKGAVNEKQDMAVTWGLAKSAGSATDKRILELTSAPHYAPAPLLPGHFQLMTSGQPVTWFSGSASEQAPDLRVLGNWPDAPSLAVLEAGGEQWTASSSAAVFGNNSEYSNYTGYGDLTKLHAATQVTLPGDARVKSIAAYLWYWVPKRLRFGLYTNHAGEPGRLLAQTPSVTQSSGVGWRTIAFSKPILVPAGTYWLAMAMCTDSGYFYETSSGGTRHASSGTDPRDGLMSTWTGTVATSARKISICANYDTTALSAGRRVQLPWGASGFDFESLTDEGKSLLRRAVEWAGDRSPGNASSPFAVTGAVHAAQYFLPNLPTNTTRWKITRAMVALKSADAPTTGAALTFELRKSNTACQPSNTVLQSSAAIPVTNWSSDRWSWYQIPWNAESDLDRSAGVCIVVRTSSDSAAAVSLDQGGVPATAGTHFLKSQDGGVTWSSPNDAQDMRFYVYGTYTTSGTAQW